MENIEDFEIAKCANCQSPIGQFEALCLPCTTMMRSYEEDLDYNELIDNRD